MGSAKVVARKADKLTSPPVKLKDWDAVARYKAAHLKPVARGPKGQPIYDYEDIKALNIEYPDERKP